MELTFRCNNLCKHCYCGAAPDDAGQIQREMSTASVLRLIDELVDMGCLWFLITGGEPMLRPDFREIYLHAKKRGLLVIIFTNGTLIDDEMAAFLKAGGRAIDNLRLCTPCFGKGCTPRQQKGAHAQNAQ